MQTTSLASKIDELRTKACQFDGVRPHNFAITCAHTSTNTAAITSLVLIFWLLSIPLDAEFRSQHANKHMLLTFFIIFLIFFSIKKSIKSHLLILLYMEDLTLNLFYKLKPGSYVAATGEFYFVLTLNLLSHFTSLTLHSYKSSFPSLADSITQSPIHSLITLSMLSR